MKNGDMDGKHSWIVAVAGCFVFLLSTWPLKVSGQLFVAILDSIEADRNKASFPFTLAFSISNLSGPFVGLLGGKFGLQTVTVSGGIFCAVGVGACFFTENIGLISASFGVIYGVGFGLSTLVIPEILNYHFDRHRSKALGVVIGGCGLGAFLTPPLLEKILIHYQFSGTLLVMSAIILNCVPFAMLLSVPKRKSKQSCKQQSTTVESNTCNNINNCLDSTMQNHNIPQLVNTICQNAELHIQNNDKVNKSHKLVRCCWQDSSILDKSTLDLINVLWSPPFLLITAIQSFNLFLQYTTWTITVDLARDKGVEKHQEAYFVMGLSLFEVIGSFTLSTINDCTRRWVAVTHFCAICFAVIGFTCLLITWVYGFIATMLSICFLAIINGGNATALPHLVTEFIPEEKRVMTMASRFTLYAPLSFTMSPLIGYFRGTLGSYDGLLYVMTSVGCVSVILLIILPSIANYGKLKLSCK